MPVESENNMNIKYANGTTRTTSNRRDDIVACLQADIGDHVIYAGLVWDEATAAEYPQDDGQKAKAKLYHDDGTEAVDFD